MTTGTRVKYKMQERISVTAVTTHKPKLRGLPTATEQSNMAHARSIHVVHEGHGKGESRAESRVLVPAVLFTVDGIWGQILGREKNKFVRETWWFVVE